MLRLKANHHLIFTTKSTMDQEQKPKPSIIWSILTMRCPRCRRGSMFKNKNPYKKFSINYMLDSYTYCPVCGQKFKLEPGFWFGTSYVSYGIMVFISAITFFLWWLIIGFSGNDYLLVYWIIANAVVIFLLQPYVMRLSRLLFLGFFIRYNPNFDEEPPENTL